MPAKRSSSRHARPRRTSDVVRIVATGVVLGILIVGIGALANVQSPVPAPGPVLPVSAVPTAPVSVTPTSVPSAVTTETASNVDTSTTDPGSSATLTVDAWLKPVASLAALLPRKVAGYTAGSVDKNKTSAIMPLEPEVPGPVAGKASIAVLTVLDKKTEAGAQAYVDSFQRAYSKDLGVVTVGTLTGRFGTDGLHLAAVVFSRGRYAFEIVLTASRGKPVDLQPLVVQAAEAFGATKTAP